MSEINESLIEAPLKALLEDVLFCLEGYLEGQNDLKMIEHQLKDYDSLAGLVKIIGNVFKTLMKKVDKKITQLKLNINDNSSYRSYHPEEEYEKLEQIIQKHEAEIRGHISIEQQLKLYSETLQQKIEDLEKQHKETIEQMHKQMHLLKKDLGKSNETYRQLIKENEQLRESVEHPPKAIMHTEGETKSTLTQIYQFCHSDHRLKKVDYSSEYPTSSVNLHSQNSMRHSAPFKSQSQHHKSGKLNNQIQHRNSQEQDLFIKYNQLLKSHAQSITQRSQIIQASQYLLKGGFANTKKQRSTLNVISDICNAQMHKSSQRNKSQGNSAKAGNTNSQNNINASNKSTTQKIIQETSKTNEAIQRLLKLK
ncbi:unnamed protein product (macronuclear) [Paramecium tetraurelia]|uniref:Uncharacterized protein n=1 Tax=Paramecium tetraurelia TaxID=5888 RepID=A0C7G2_PARTE|nr:uncharacterized protein GSPATT00035859001 [Paramecium tetraurelia]CAK66729.1 unnamed protein product [Paramecium tetraurelia]|eukprot:XP_001434126.1 hypothetical protein (macronuclear) [Paramecium tetraurelia strain d4-2]